MVVRRPALALACSLALAPCAVAGTPHLQLGILGDSGRFHALTGQEPEVGHAILGWGQGQAWGASFDRLLGGLGPVPMVALKTGAGWPNESEAITPRDIALGGGDGYLIALNQAIASWGKPIYVRPYAEMNAHWNFYCAYRPSGTLKGPSHSTAMFRKAFARTYIILHGGSAEAIDLKLSELGLPGVGVDLPANPPPRLKVIWNPQGYGSPDFPGNAAEAYYPGDAFVDVVADDLYDIEGKAEWDAAEALYRAHPHKPFAFPEWGLWGLDDPGFVRAMARFVRTHKRVELISYFNSKPGSIFDLETKPRSRAAYRAVISGL